MNRDQKFDSIPNQQPNKWYLMLEYTIQVTDPKTNKKEIKKVWTTMSNKNSLVSEHSILMD